MKIRPVKAPKPCFDELEKWFSVRRMTDEYPDGWALRNSFANCKPMQVYRFPLMLLNSPTFPANKMENIGWSFIHKDLEGKLGSFTVNMIKAKKSTLGYQFNHANYGNRAFELLDILRYLKKVNVFKDQSLEYTVNILTGGPFFAYSLWLQPINRGLDLFIELSPHFNVPVPTPAEKIVLDGRYPIYEYERFASRVKSAIEHHFSAHNNHLPPDGFNGPIN